jgi:predicted kinase
MKTAALWKCPGCPEPPDWQVTWPQLQRDHPWLRELDGVVQDPRHHAEGDVLTHTRMVVESLVAMSSWRTLPPGERQILFAAALLHDVGKAACTRIEPDGAITSKHHARRSEVLSRKLLWEGSGSPWTAPFAIREQISLLVREHGLPLWFLEKPQPARRVIRTSLGVGLDRLALLAEADARGRVCADQEDLLRRIELFRDYARELRCHDQPRAFASAHSRFVFFHSEKEQPDPDYAAHDTTAFEVILLSGLPGAGKDTWIKPHRPDWPVVSLDALRRESKTAGDDEQGRVVQTARERARELLRAQQPFIWNATNVTRRLRTPLVELFAAYRACVRIVYVEAPLSVILARNRGRASKVPEKIIHHLLDRLEIPTLDEAHAVEWIA